MWSIVYKNQYHVIFCTKYRRKVFANGIDTRLKEIIYAETSKMAVEIKSIEIMPDHVYVFLECDPRLPLHKVIKQLKGVSSRILRDEFPSLKSRIPSLWTRSYFSCTVGHISETTVMKYIEEQKSK